LYSEQIAGETRFPQRLTWPHSTRLRDEVRMRSPAHGEEDQALSGKRTVDL
jgi:hypothetical protein